MAELSPSKDTIGGTAIPSEARRRLLIHQERLNHMDGYVVEPSLSKDTIGGTATPNERLNHVDGYVAELSKDTIGSTAIPSEARRLLLMHQERLNQLDGYVVELSKDTIGGTAIPSEARRISVVTLILAAVQPSVSVDMHVDTNGASDARGSLSSSDQLSIGSQLADLVQNHIKHGSLTISTDNTSDYTLTADQHNVEHKHEHVIRFSTANVSTLSPKDVGSNLCKGHLCMSARISLLEYSFNEAGCDVIGLQESCIQKHGAYNGTHYAMYMSSGSPQGNYGSQLWIRHSLGVRIHEVRYISARLFAAVDTKKKLTYVNISGHAPHESSPAKYKDEFWNSIDTCTAALSSESPHACTVLLCDANALVGSFQCPAIGPSFRQVENDNGRRFRMYLDEHMLVATNTYLAGAPTWSAGVEFTRRLDYTAVSAGMTRSGTGTGILSSVDLFTAARNDHRSIFVDLLPVPPLHRSSKIKRLGVHFY